MMHVLHVVGARPNFVKLAPVYRALSGTGTRQTLLHTGQHYDANMSQVFFRHLELSDPDLNLEVGSGSHAYQTAQVMMRLEPVLLEYRPDWVLVYGDVNSTVAASLVCVKLGIRHAHVEAGLRSRDRTMPEEHNRIVTDHLADLLFTPSRDGNENLTAEGIPEERVRFVGNVMIDALIRLLPKAQALCTRDIVEDSNDFALVTLHRPSTVDDPAVLGGLLECLESIGRELQVVFPIHPRTRGRIANQLNRVKTTEPLGYLEFLALESRAALVITDSGGVQEETTFLGVPCLTVRENTERPITITMGTNELVGTDPARLMDKVAAVRRGEWKKGKVPPLWDGRAAIRIAENLMSA